MGSLVRGLPVLQEKPSGSILPEGNLLDYSISVTNQPIFRSSRMSISM